jgi:hypothetical protein
MIVNAAIFTCSICGETSTNICAYCTKDACSNHRCERCKRCSDCCECEIPLSAEEPLGVPPVESPTIESPARISSAVESVTAEEQPAAEEQVATQSAAEETPGEEEASQELFVESENRVPPRAVHPSVSNVIFTAAESSVFVEGSVSTEPLETAEPSDEPDKTSDPSDQHS